MRNWNLYSWQRTLLISALTGILVALPEPGENRKLLDFLGLAAAVALTAFVFQFAFCWVGRRKRDVQNETHSMPSVQRPADVTNSPYVLSATALAIAEFLLIGLLVAIVIAEIMLWENKWHPITFLVKATFIILLFMIVKVRQWYLSVRKRN